MFETRKKSKLCNEKLSSFELFGNYFSMEKIHEQRETLRKLYIDYLQDIKLTVLTTLLEIDAKKDEKWMNEVLPKAEDVSLLIDSTESGGQKESSYLYLVDFRIGKFRCMMDMTSHPDDGEEGEDDDEEKDDSQFLVKWQCDDARMVAFANKEKKSLDVVTLMDLVTQVKWSDKHLELLRKHPRDVHLICFLRVLHCLNKYVVENEPFPAILPCACVTHLSNNRTDWVFPCLGFSPKRSNFCDWIS